MEERQVTIHELVKMTIDDLKTLSIPAEMLEKMGPPISRALSNLKVMDDVFTRAENEEAAKKHEEAGEASEEPQIEIAEANKEI